MSRKIERVGRWVKQAVLAEPPQASPMPELAIKDLRLLKDLTARMREMADSDLLLFEQALKRNLRRTNQDLVQTRGGYDRYTEKFPAFEMVFGEELAGFLTGRRSLSTGIGGAFRGLIIGRLIAKFLWDRKIKNAEELNARAAALLYEVIKIQRSRSQ